MIFLLAGLSDCDISVKHRFLGYRHSALFQGNALHGLPVVHASPQLAYQLERSLSSEKYIPCQYFAFRRRMYLVSHLGDGSATLVHHLHTFCQAARCALVHAPEEAAIVRG